MLYRPINGQKASVVGFGAWAIGGWMWGGADEADAVDAIHASLDHGINLIDTAPIYGFGRSEEIVGKAIKGKRDKVFLATKCGMVWEPEFADKGEHKFNSDEDTIRDNAKMDVRIYLHPDSIRREVEVSLKWLQTDHIDLYQTHWQESTTPIADSMGALDKLRTEGKIRAIGVSNATPAHMDQYRAVAPLHGDQENYSMLVRRAQKTNLPYCKKHGIAFLAYSPLARGLLTGKITPGHKFGKGDHRPNDKLFSPGSIARVQELLKKMQPIAEAHGITLSQLTLAWTFHQPGCTHVLAGARNRKQVADNAGAGDAKLSANDLAATGAALEEYETVSVK